jgi:predicted secreted acid phosphatase
MSEEITTRLLKMVTDISEAVNRTAQDVAVMKAQQEERKESQAKAIENIRCIQMKQGDDIEDLKKNRDKITGSLAAIVGIPSVIIAICTVLNLMKR